MTKASQLVLIGSVGLTLCFNGDNLMGQDTQGARRQRQGNFQGGGRQRTGNFDPTQFQQQILERYRDRLEIPDDAEWKAIKPLIQKVIESRTAIGFAARTMYSRGGRPGGDANQNDQSQRRLGATSNGAADQLQKTVDSKASSGEVKAALARYYESRKQQQADLEKAQAALRSVLSARQEAIAALSGLL